MIVDAKHYNLQDFTIFTSTKDFDFFVWQPDKTYIVIGRANTVDASVFMEEAYKDGVEILKRPSGGESVILSPKTMVISVKLKINNALNTHKYFKIINEQIISALQQFGIQHLNMKGISDISIGDKKILGSSIYRKSDIIFYHAVLNVSESAEQIERYLKHPKREPDYRNGRSHHAFVTSLHKEGFVISVNKLTTAIKSRLEIIPLSPDET